MKLIEAMKRIKALRMKVDDLGGKIAMNCADLSHENPVYGTEEKHRAQVQEWIDSARDTLKEILRLRVAVQRTNIATPVAIEVGGVTVTKSIAEWIHRRKDLAALEQQIWARLTDKNLKDGWWPTTAGEKIPVKVRRYFDPAVRDKQVELFRNEPMQIDSILETVNAVTDLIEEPAAA